MALRVWAWVVRGGGARLGFLGWGGTCWVGAGWGLGISAIPIPPHFPQPIPSPLSFPPSRPETKNRTQAVSSQTSHQNTTILTEEGELKRKRGEQPPALPEKGSREVGCGIRNV